MLQGLLITGPPGAGKSFLVDLWYDSLPTPYKTRKHYSELVLELYRAVRPRVIDRSRKADVHESLCDISPASLLSTRPRSGISPFTDGRRR